MSDMEGAVAPATGRGTVKRGQARASLGEFLMLGAALDTAGAVRLAIGRDPAHVISDAPGSRAYVTSGEANAVIVIDLARGRIIDTIPTAAGPHGIRAPRWARAVRRRHEGQCNIRDRRGDPAGSCARAGGARAGAGGPSFPMASAPT